MEIQYVMKEYLKKQLISMKKHGIMLKMQSKQHKNNDDDGDSDDD